MSKLIIVESPTKCKTIGKILGKDFIIKSTLGHIRDLPKHRIGVDLKNDFEPVYDVYKEKKKTVSELISYIKKAKDVYIATDEDREGEAIGWHVVKAANLDENKYKRISFHEITPSAIKAALKSPRSMDMDLVDAQQARRILDRLVGYKLSPLLAKKLYKGLSAGRVQSVTVRIIVEREREINNFVKEEYWSIKAECTKKGQQKKFIANFTAKAKKKYKRQDIKNKKEVDNLLEGIDKSDFVVKNITKKKRKRNPHPPFITSTLQQSSSRAVGYSAKKTMFVAQSLYEGVSLGEDTVGLITYMRTDSVSIAQDARKEVKDFIKKTYGQEYVPEKQRVYKSKVKNAQEAHECIRPTSVKRTPESVKSFLNNEQIKLYKLIWDRFVASQMKEALFDQENVEIEAKDTLWNAHGQVCIFDGYKKVYKHDSYEEDEDKTSLPILEKGENLNVLEILPEQHFTEPPPRYSEATLIKALETHGIGRPSTYAPTMTTILQRGYVRLESKRFVPQEIGVTVTEILEKHFPNIVDIEFTAGMEEDLDKISLGSKNWRQMLKEFYTPFEKTLKDAEEQIKSQKKEKILDRKCPKCGEFLIIRNSRYGEFIACSAFPKCKYTESEESEEDQKIEQELEPCPQCGKKLVLKNSRFGKFIACSGYPKCRFSRSLEEEKIDKECPDCGKPLVVKKSRRGKFLGCSGYPECKHVEKMPQ